MCSRLGATPVLTLVNFCRNGRVVHCTSFVIAFSKNVELLTALTRVKAGFSV